MRNNNRSSARGAKTPNYALFERCDVAQDRIKPQPPLPSQVYLNGGLNCVQYCNLKDDMLRLWTYGKVYGDMEAVFSSELWNTWVHVQKYGARVWKGPHRRLIGDEDRRKMEEVANNPHIIDYLVHHRRFSELLRLDQWINLFLHMHMNGLNPEINEMDRQYVNEIVRRAASEGFSIKEILKDLEQHATPSEYNAIIYLAKQHCVELDIFVK